MKKLYVDPPSGWRYGFPKKCPSPYHIKSKRWFIDQGYPLWLIEQGMLKHVRFWYADENETERKELGNEQNI